MTLPSISVDDDAGASLDLTALTDLAGHVYSELHIHPESELGITVVDIERMTTLHEDWMNEPGPTDVLSFPIDELTPGSPENPSGPGVLGDIVLCPEYAKPDAQQANRTLDQHMQFLTVHGLLHLLGYDHATEEDYEQMFTLQDRLLDSWQVAR
ncbi:MAG TPA: rRNA maturation RNase YbeY [Candidatus Nanopelagicales bacterium]|nr:rRNA maturation RNase YbeY [Candidatus Nanopelagicales bacterium]